jgi:hypothetical protein
MELAAVVTLLQFHFQTAQFLLRGNNRKKTNPNL